MTANARTEVHLPDPRAAFAHLARHIAEHGIDAEHPADDHVRFRHEGCTLDIRHDVESVTIEIAAPSANMLFFLKEAAAVHVSDVDPIAGEALRWSDGGAATPQPLNFRALTLVGRAEPFPGMVRLTLTGDDVAGLAQDGLHVKLMLPADRGRPPVWPRVGANGVTKWPKGSDRLHVRYFTIRALRPDAAEVDIDVVQHDGGMISDWAREAARGDAIGVMGPGGGGPPGSRRGLLFAGDETALPAIARIMADLGDDADGDVVVAWPGGADIASYLPRSPLTITALPPDRFRADIVDTVRRIGAENAIRYAWFGGEHDNAQTLRGVFKEEFNLAKGDQLSVAYWRAGIRGDASREHD